MCKKMKPPCYEAVRWKHRHQLIRQWWLKILDWLHKKSNPNCFSIHEYYHSIAHASTLVQTHDETLNFSQLERTLLFLIYIFLIISYCYIRICGMLFCADMMVLFPCSVPLSPCFSLNLYKSGMEKIIFLLIKWNTRTQM